MAGSKNGILNDIITTRLSANIVKKKDCRKLVKTWYIRTSPRKYIFLKKYISNVRKLVVAKLKLKVKNESASVG